MAKSRLMKLTIPLLIMCGLIPGILPGAPRSGQETSPSPARPIEIPVRITGPDGQFIDSLTLDDFVLSENGVPQKIDGFYLVKGQSILSKAGTPIENPQVARHYYLMFQAIEYDPKLAEVVDTLFRNLLRPGDTMTLMTPAKAYSLTPQALAAKPKDVLSKEMNQILRKDIQIGGSDYRSLLRDLKRLVKSIEGENSAFDPEMETDTMTTSAVGLEVLLERYRDSLMKMEDLRLIDERKILSFAQALKNQTGQKNVFLFYQREFRPEINPTFLNTMMSLYQDQQEVLSMLMELFQFYKRETTYNQDRISRAFADASLMFNFIFMNKESQYLFGADMKEQSEDVFSVYSQVAKATGGLCETAPNPAASFKKAVVSSEDSYLLYYTPSNPAKDKTFRSVTVAVKRAGVTVFHRLGYYAF
jgi:VWFA-related protein